MCAPKEAWIFCSIDDSVQEKKCSKFNVFVFEEKLNSEYALEEDDDDDEARKKICSCF